MLTATAACLSWPLLCVHKLKLLIAYIALHDEIVPIDKTPTVSWWGDMMLPPSEELIRCGGEPDVCTSYKAIVK